MREEVTRSEVLYRGKILSLRRDSVVLTKGERQVEAVREVVEHDPTVVIVPVDDDDNVLLVRQYRHSTGMVLLEAPAGGIEPGEDPQQAVQRELQEETGHTARRVVPLGSFWIAPGWATEYMHVFLARGLDAAEACPDEDEAIEVERVPRSRVLDLVRRGEIQDAKSIAALLMAFTLGPEQPPQDDFSQASEVV